MTSFFKKIANASWFQNTVTITILLAGVLVGIETYADLAEKYHVILGILNKAILGIFIAEIVVKMGAEGKKPWMYFTDAWNIFDFIIVAAAFMPFGGSSIAILRLLRLLRVLKLIKALPKLQMLVGALLKSIPSMGYVSILLFLLFYIYAVAGVFFFGANDPVHFGDLQTSMLSLFRAVTLEDWTDLMYINMYGCDQYGYDAGSTSPCISPAAAPGLAVSYFVSFVLIGTMIILNLFIGVIMNGMDDARAEMAEEDRLANKTDAIQIDDIEEKITELQGLLSVYKKENS